MSVFTELGMGVLKLIPGVGQLTTVLETVSKVAGAIGGDTGKKIADGLAQVTEGLDAAGKQPLSPEQQVQIEAIGKEHEATMRGHEVADKQGARSLIKDEIASGDKYISHTRPMLLRLTGISTVVLVLLCVVIGAVAAVWGGMDKDQGTFLLMLFGWAVSAVTGLFLFMYRIYTGKRSQDKMVAQGMMPEGILDKLLKFKTGGK